MNICENDLDIYGLKLSELYTSNVLRRRLLSRYISNPNIYDNTIAASLPLGNINPYISFVTDIIYPTFKFAVVPLIP
jgi:hypothetical protein